MLESLPHQQEGVLYERLYYLGLGTIWFLFAYWIAVKYKLSELPEERFKQLPLNFLRHLIGVFSVFFFIELVLVPINILLWLKYAGAEKLPEYAGGWITLAAMLLATVGVLLYYQFLPAATKEVVQGSKGNHIQDFFAGVLTWFFAAPAILIISQIIGLLLPLISQPVKIDQNVVQHLKLLANYPVLFWTTALGVISIVPIVEEILFRGFLQSWLHDIFGRGRAIFLTSAIFAGFHFSFTQGIFNVELLFSLFVLSCFLGFIYEKRETVWASIGLHFIFNLIGVIMIASETKLV